MILDDMTENEQRLVNYLVSLRTDINTIDENVLFHALKRAEEDILNFIHDEEVPKGLEMVWVDMTNRYIEDATTKTKVLDLTDTNDFNIKSVTMGDTTIAKSSPFEMIQAIRQAPSQLSQFKTSLYRYRKLL